jgi:hypothetical protein
LRPLADRLREFATLKTLDGADHSFHVLKRSGRTDQDVQAEMLAAFMTWSGTI